jgi:hypothetical protein
MTNNFYPPITPPPELVKQWCYEDGDEVSTSPRWFHIVCTKAARWGADHELEACCEWLVVGQWFAPDGECINDLRAARRPQPPSLKEQALKALKNIDDACESEGFSRSDDTDIIRCALESLPE